MEQIYRGIGHHQPIRIKLVTEAALLGSAIEHGLSPEMIVLSDGAKQFAILVHALCWVHIERSLRRLNGVTAQQRQEPIASPGNLVGLLS